MYHSCTISCTISCLTTLFAPPFHPTPPTPPHPLPVDRLLREQHPTMVDLQNSNAVTRRPMKATAAIMNPVPTILALRSGNVLQMFNLDLQAKMKSSTLPSPVLFWRWTSPQNIALVTAEEVLHWSGRGGRAAR